jgi:hypothetical protein
MPPKTSRRQFLKTSTVFSAGAAVVGGFTLAQSAHAAGSDEMKIALIGCGSRGNGAIRDRVQVGDNVKVVAVADVFEGRARWAANSLRNDGNNAESNVYGKVDLPNDRVFVGFESYKQAIACLDPGDYVILATPPGFRPYQYRNAIERGCHVFMEKPVCVDAPGYRHSMETNQMADEKNLKVCVGFQRRYELRYSDWIEQIHAGAIGDILYTRGYWNQNIWYNPRNPGESEMDYQLRNWYHFVWLCGENIVEQHCHNIDICNWIHGKGDRMAHPVEANAQGGRTFRAGPDELMRQAPPFADREAWDAWYQPNRQRFTRHGQAWDHFFVEFTYADGSRMFSQCRHMPRTWDYVDEHVHGTAGHGTTGSWGGPSQLNGHDGGRIWTSGHGAPKGPYQWQHDVHVTAIREDTPMNDGYHSSIASMAAVLGREAAYSGRIVQWDELVERGRSYFPDGEITSFEQMPPVQPDADGFYESSVPVPGMYDPFA